MKAHELRVGNYLKFGEMRHACNHWDIRNLEIDEAKGVESPTYQPIPITERFLLQFGFVKRGELYAIDEDKFHTFSIVLGDDYTRLSFPIISSRDGENFKLYGIRYINQLQNLYFALTGIELKIK